MEFRRITNLPPYVFSIINGLKIDARRSGVDVIDLGFGNPDIPSPDIAVQKLAEAATKPANHRYSLSRGLPKLREAIAGYYQNTWGVERVAVLAQRVRHEPVVGRVRRRGEEPPVEEDLARVVVDLVLVAAPSRDLDHDVDAAFARHLGHGRQLCLKAEE